MPIPCTPRRPRRRQEACQTHNKFKCILTQVQFWLLVSFQYGVRHVPTSQNAVCWGTGVAGTSRGDIVSPFFLLTPASVRAHSNRILTTQPTAALWSLLSSVVKRYLSPLNPVDRPVSGVHLRSPFARQCNYSSVFHWRSTGDLPHFSFAALATST